MLGLVRLLGLYYRSVDHLTICTEGVVCYRKQVVVLGNPVSLVCKNFTGRTCIVVCAVNQHQTTVGLYAIYVPPQFAALFNNTVLNFGFFGNNRSIGLLGLVRLLGLYYRSIEHLTVCTKGVVCYGKQIVVLGNPILAVGENFTGRTCIVVIAINKKKSAIIRHAVFHIVYTVYCRINNAGIRSHVVCQLTIGSKSIPIVTFRHIVAVNRNTSDSSVHVVIFTEIVLLACKSYPATLNESGTYTITSAGAIGSKCTHGGSIFSKDVGDTTNGYGLISVQFVIVPCITIHCVRSTTIDVIITLVGAHILPALYELAVYSVIQGTVNVNYACAKNSNVTASCANESCVNNFIVVTGSFNNSTKIYNRLTSLTVGTASITVFGTRSLLICKNNKLCIMNMVRRRNSCEFGCNVNGATEGVTVNNTANNVNVNVYNGHITFNRHILIRYIVVTIPSPNSYGNAYESVIESLAAYTVSFNSYSKDLGDLVILKCSIEAVCNNCTLSFPSVCVVKFELSNEFVYVCKVCNVDIHIVDRLCLRRFAGVIMTTESDYSITCNSKGASELHGVTKLVLNLKSDCVLACAKNNVTLCGEYVSIDRRLNYYTINSNLTRSKVESCIICNSSRKSNVITNNFCTITKSNSYVRCRICRICNSRKNSIVYSRAIVESNIVNVERKLSRSSRLYIGTNKRRRTRVTFIGSNGSAEIIILGNVDRHIYPTRFGNIRLCRRVQVRPIAGCSRGKHKVVLLTRIRAVSILYIELRLERKTRSAHRNINPHTKCSSFHTICNVTKNDGLANIKENVVRPARKSCIGIVKSPCKRIVTISNFATICGRRNKCIAAEVLIELTCKRS